MKNIKFLSYIRVFWGYLSYVTHAIPWVRLVKTFVHEANPSAKNCLAERWPPKTPMLLHLNETKSFFMNIWHSPALILNAVPAKTALTHTWSFFTDRRQFSCPQRWHDSGCVGGGGNWQGKLHSGRHYWNWCLSHPLSQIQCHRVDSSASVRNNYSGIHPWEHSRIITIYIWVDQKLHTSATF